LLEQALARDGSKGPWIYRRLAAAYAVRAERDKAYENLERAVAMGLVDYRTLQRLPVFAEMRAEPRFQECVEEMTRRVAKMRVKVEAQEAA